MPDALSTYIVTVEQPITAANVVPTASESIASFTRGMRPSGPTIPVLEASPINVPTVSKTFMNSSVRITTAMSGVSNCEKSNLQKVGAGE